MRSADYSKPLTGVELRARDLDLSATCLVVTATVASMSTGGPALLDRHEATRLTEFLSADAERRFVAGARLLRFVVSRLTDQPPAEVVVDRRCPDCSRTHGRPRVGNGEFHVSVSHSGDAVQVACTRAASVGVDIQARCSRVTPAMLALLGRGRDLQPTAEAFLVTWTRIEAVVKATGEGLSVPLDQVQVSPPHELPQLLSYRGGPLACQLYAQRERINHTGSVAILTETPVELVELSAREFLGPVT